MITFSWVGHRRRLRLLVHAGLLLVWAAGAALILLYAWAAHAGRTRTVPSWFGWCLLGGLLVWNALRPGAGRESLAIAPGLLLHSRAVGPFMVRRRFELSDIEQPRSIRVTLRPRRTYRIEFSYRGSVRRVGAGLSSSEADCLVRLIDEARERARLHGQSSR